jgi:hypothetical protein
MTSTPLSRGHLALRIVLFSALAGSVGIVGCKGRTRDGSARVFSQAESLPSGCPPNTQPNDTTQLRACLTGIEFDATESIGDEQRLMVIGSGPGTGLPCAGDPTHNCRYGPLAKIEPVKGADTYNNTVLAEGRIIARMFLRAGETDSYPKFGLVPGDTTYWWVNIEKDSSRFVHRVSGDADLNITPRGLTRTSHPEGTYEQAFANWVWSETDETANGNCGSACCKP